MDGWTRYLATAREAQIRAYKALPSEWHRERQFRRRNALHYSRLLRDHTA